MLIGNGKQGDRIWLQNKTNKKKHTMSSFAEMKQWLYELFYINLKLGNAKHRCIFLHAKRKASLESIHLSSRELH